MNFFLRKEGKWKQMLKAKYAMSDMMSQNPVWIFAVLKVI